MANTLIRIRRADVTLTPANGALIGGELAYSFASDRLFIGNNTGNIVEIGGRYWMNTIVAAFATANAASAGSLDAPARVTGNIAFAHANAAFITANQAFAHANAAFAQDNIAFVVANSSFLHANAAFATVNAAFGVANNALPKAGGTVTGDVIITGNLTISGCTTYSNTNTLVIGDNILVLNADLPSTASPSEDTGFLINRGNQSNVGLLWIEAGKQFVMQVNTGIQQVLVSNSALESTNAIAVGAFASANAGQATANAAFNKANTANSDIGAAFLRANQIFAIANTANSDVGAAFLRANQVYALANSATAQAANADFLTTGTVLVGRGGTGLNTVTTNGILYGQGTGAMIATAAGTEGQVLQANFTGVPIFAHLDGGTF